MDRINSVSKYVSQLSIKQIENLSDEEMKIIRMQRPFHPEQFGFILNLAYFQSKEHHINTYIALMRRLGKVSK